MTMKTHVKIYKENIMYFTAFFLKIFLLSFYSYASYGHYCIFSILIHLCIYIAGFRSVQQGQALYIIIFFLVAVTQQDYYL